MGDHLQAADALTPLAGGAQSVSARGMPCVRVCVCLRECVCMSVFVSAATAVLYTVSRRQTGRQPLSALAMVVESSARPPLRDGCYSNLLFFYLELRGAKQSKMATL